MADHPVKVPPKLFTEWLSEPYKDGAVLGVANRAAQWGADQELEACCEWIKDDGWHQSSEFLFAARRPKPPSLAEQGLQALETGCSLTDDGIDIIKAALQRLKQLENQP